MDMVVSNINTGPLVSKFVASNFIKVLTNMKSYKEKIYEQALIETFLKFDDLLRDERVNNFLKENSKVPKKDMYVDYSIDYEFSTYVKSPSNNYAYKENQTNETSSDKNDGTKDILLLDNSKLEMSLKSSTRESGGQLVASNMGTTANILLIRNNKLFLANVGDSLAVLYKNGQAIKLNHEHKTSLQSEYARIDKSGAKIINNRINGMLNLTRAIGNTF
jgi:hypothetical protein